MVNCFFGIMPKCSQLWKLVGGPTGQVHRFHCIRETHLGVDAFVFIMLLSIAWGRRGMDVGFWWESQKERYH
jgi:hypothetical protein